MIGVIEYKAGNAPSVLNALSRIGVEARLVSDSCGLKEANGIILPGVGSAGATMESLRELGLIETLQDEVIGKKKPFMGICVGLQVLFENSEEGNAECLGWLSGSVRKFDAGKIRVPQIGWNETFFEKKSRLTEGLKNSDYFYFVNSYYAKPGEKSDILATTEYGEKFVSMIEHENIFATQFHAEKSGESGLVLLKNFCGIAGETKC